MSAVLLISKTVMLIVFAFALFFGMAMALGVDPSPACGNYWLRSQDATFVFVYNCLGRFSQSDCKHLRCFMVLLRLRVVTTMVSSL